MNATIIALIGYFILTVGLLIALAGYRTMMVLKKQRAPNNFSTTGDDVPALGKRLTRAYGNCVESAAFICGTMLLALATGTAVITNPLALWLLAARVGQSVTHVMSTSNVAVQIRFVFFVVQVAIIIYWLVLLFNRFWV